jgi:hypothetical protein
VYFPGYTFKKEVEVEKNSLFQQATKGLAVISEANKLNAANDRTGGESEKKQIPQENNPPLSTKHAMQVNKMQQVKETVNPLSPRSVNINYAQPIQSKQNIPNVKFKLPGKIQANQILVKQMGRQQCVNIGGIRKEVQKHPIMPSKGLANAENGVETNNTKVDGFKRGTTPTRKFK